MRNFIVYYFLIYFIFIFFLLNIKVSNTKLKKKEKEELFLLDHMQIWCLIYFASREPPIDNPALNILS